MQENKLGLIFAGWIAYMAGLLVYATPVLQALSFLFGAAASAAAFIWYIKKILFSNENDN